MTTGTIECKFCGARVYDLGHTVMGAMVPYEPDGPAHDVERCREVLVAKVKTMGDQSDALYRALETMGDQSDALYRALETMTDRWSDLAAAIGVDHLLRRHEDVVAEVLAIRSRHERTAALLREVRGYVVDAPAREVSVVARLDAVLPAATITSASPS